MAPQLTTPSRPVSSNDRIVRRKLMKQMVERRRRERIDLCLDNIKTLVLTNLNKNPADYEKMEKADILEMTVHYLARLVKGQRTHSARQFVYSHATNQAQQMTPQGLSQSHVSTTRPYTNGYHRCLQQTRHFMENTSASAGLKTRLVSHLQSSLSSKNTSTSKSGSSSNSQSTQQSIKSELNVDTDSSIRTNCSRRNNTSCSPLSNSEQAQIQKLEQEVSPMQSGAYWRPW